jgi:SAM-dependent methyltransferase
MRLGTWLLKQTHSDRTGRTIADRLRRRRWEVACEALQLTGTESVLDVGGDDHSWWFVDWPGRLVRVNLDRKAPGVTVIGDGCKLPFRDRAFDVTFSNSTIEHITDPEARRQFAAELQRTGKRYFCQTANFWFPIEPHYLFPFYQFLPGWLQHWLRMHFDLGTVSRGEEDKIRLLSRTELRRLFPGAVLLAERIGPLVKSWYAVG